MTSSRRRSLRPAPTCATSDAPLRAAAAEQSRAAPRIDALPATTRTASFHLCADRDRRGHHPATSPASTRWAAAPDVSRPMSTTSTIPHVSGPSPISIPGLSAWKVTVRSAASTRPCAPPVACVEPARDVDGEHARPPTAGAFHDVPARSPVPKAASITRSAAGSDGGQSATSTSSTRTPASAQPVGSDPAVGTVVARPDQHVDGAAVRTAEHLAGGPPDRAPRPPDQRRRGHRRGGVDRRASPRR